MSAQPALVKAVLHTGQHAAQQAGLTPAAGRGNASGADPAPQPLRDSGLVLRVLSGSRAGVQVPVRHRRLLVGNQADECDVVLETDEPGNQSCLIRISADGWSAMALDGTLRLGARALERQQPSLLRASDVLTLGGVSFCIDDPSNLDERPPILPVLPEPALVSGARVVHSGLWLSRVTGPLGRWLPAGWLHRAARQTSQHRSRSAPVQASRGQERMLLQLLSVLGLLMLLAAVALLAGSPHQAAVPESLSTRLTAARAGLAQRQGTTDLRIDLAPGGQSLVASGYLADAESAADVKKWLQSQGWTVRPNWTLISDSRNEILRRLGAPAGGSPLGVQHQGGGVFQIHARHADRWQLDERIRLAMAAMPRWPAAILSLSTSDAQTGPLTTWRYERRPDGTVASDGPRADPATTVGGGPRVMEIRQGALPSVVLADGGRYFAGATLPGGAVLLRIVPGQIEVQQGGQVQRIALETRSASPP